MNPRLRTPVATLLLATAWTSSGCQSPYFADRGAGVGALGGAGVGALVGNATGNTAAGALIGAGVGAVSGAVVGSAIDEAQAQNRAELAAVMGRQVTPGAATIEEVIAMNQQGVAPPLIANYVRTSGMARPLTAGDVIYLHQAGVSNDVIQMMQTASTAPPPGVPVVAQGPPVIVQEHYYGSPWYGPSVHYYHGPRYRSCAPPPRVSWGVSVAR